MVCAEVDEKALQQTQKIETRPCETEKFDTNIVSLARVLSTFQSRLTKKRLILSVVDGILYISTIAGNRELAAGVRHPTWFNGGVS